MIHTQIYVLIMKSVSITLIGRLHRLDRPRQCRISLARRCVMLHLRSYTHIPLAGDDYVTEGIVR